MFPFLKSGQSESFFRQHFSSWHHASILLPKAFHKIFPNRQSLLLSMFDWLWTPVMETNDKDGLSHGSSSEDTVMLPDPHRVTLGLHQLSHAILSSGPSQPSMMGCCLAFWTPSPACSDTPSNRFIHLKKQRGWSSVKLCHLPALNHAKVLYRDYAEHLEIIDCFGNTWQRILINELSWQRVATIAPENMRHQIKRQWHVSALSMDANSQGGVSL